MPILALTIESLTDQLRTACLLECAARKPGNVHPAAAFEDVSFHDFVRSAEVTAPVLTLASQLGVGISILEAVAATKQAVGTNTNLGMILLLAPLAAVPPSERCADGVAAVLNLLDARDAEAVYEAIRHAAPGGLGDVPEHDVAQTPTIPLVTAMALSAERDLIARQYTNRFDDVLGFGREKFLEAVTSYGDWELAIIGTQLQFMSAFPDSLIRRKCGQEIAAESQRRAHEVLKSGWPGGVSDPALQQFDSWLRVDGHRRNPGTTADMIAAVLFSVIRDGDWSPPAVIKINEE